MIAISGYSVELVRDPFGILQGKRYEFVLDIEVDEEDELYSENGLYVRVIYSVEESRAHIVKYEIYERSTNVYLEFDMEDEERALVETFCKEHYQEAEE
ncbi:DUF6509 family protein [Paenibacillus doosanensis]|uniref:Pullulanase n=1 Tax=Paenibacillus konkukensis TaxID=2020716 RepID=A0ABY4RWP2_9BACL|nr:MULTISPECIES: DUF6509 family protein [Paenibacillus]MCS7458905.1 DUF6509 family protein [Paenibacillus doosanensis]UQZ86567.1 hypothetical protein SK3146_05860 [Paenibacillus konkukensis]